MSDQEKKKPKTQAEVDTELNTDELKNFLNHMVQNNLYLQSKGKLPVAVATQGESGYGKTSVHIQVAKQNNLSLVKLNLAQIEELGDLVGFPLRQFEMKGLEGDKVWVDEFLLDDYRHLGYRATLQKRTSYAPPEWISGKTEGGMLLLDDFNRADTRFLQAVMELIDRQTYISWTLPKGWHIMLTCNPDDGEYLVNSMDKAQKTRYVRAKLKFDVDCWARWAERDGVDGRCINFLHSHPELVSGEVNARSATNFFNAISSIESFEDDLPLINMIGEGSVGPEFTKMFTIEIANKLDKLPSPDKILFSDEVRMITLLISLTEGTKSKNYRGDIANLLAMRIINYSTIFFETNPVTAAFTTRMSKLVTSEIFTPDVCYNMVRSIFNSNTTKFQLMTLQKDLMKYIMK